MKEDTKTFMILVLVVILIIAGIYLFKYVTKVTPEEKTMTCIASKAILYSQTTCSHCKQQKEILGEYASKFNIIECDKEPSRCSDIKGTPTWEINGKLYENVKSIKELSELAGCECTANINVVKNTSESCNLNELNQTCTTPAENICTE